MPSIKILVAAIKYACHILPIVFLILGDWLLAITMIVTTFLFYAKTFKLEVYLQDLQDKSTTEHELKLEIERSIARWKCLTFLTEFRDRFARKK